MKKRKFHLLYLTAVLVSLFSLSVHIVGAITPDPTDVWYFDSSDVFWRPNNYVDIQYAEDLYLYAIDTDLDNQILVNTTVTLLSISSIDASEGTVDFTASGRDAEYSFAWSSSTPYISSVEGEITSLSIGEFQNSRLILTIAATSTTTSMTLINCGNRGEPQTINGVTNSSFNAGTSILTLNVTHASSQEIEIVWGVSGLIVTSVVAAAGFTSIVLIAGMFYGLGVKKPFEYYVGLALGVSILFITVLVVAELPILTGA